jgi:hypothetical protein
MSRGVVASHDALALALAFYEAPGRFPDLLHGRAPLPSGMTALLQVAAGDLPDGALPPMFVSLEDLRKASLFFIEQVLLARGADHYRLMGLAPGAGADEVKEHHRLLMRLFHPDRHSVPDEQAAAAAASINRAYTVLRGADSRAAYREAVQPAAVHATASAAYPRPVVPSDPRPPRRGLPPALRRHAPQLVLGAVALVAIAAVAVVYATRVPPGAIGGGALVQAPRGEAVARVPPGSQDDWLAPVARAGSAPPPGPLGEAAAAAPGARAEAAVAGARASMPGPSAAVSAPIRAPAAGNDAAVDEARPVAAVPATQPPASSLPVAAREPETLLPPSPAPVVAQASAPSGVPAAPSASSAAPTQGNPTGTSHVAAAASAASAGATTGPVFVEPPTAVLQRFVTAYERGDLEALMSLFDENARIERGGRARIRSDYDELFRGSELRSLRLRDLRWSGDGEMVRAEGAFVARVLRRGEEAMRDVGGSIRVELVRRGDRLLIIGLYHTAG